MDAQKVTEIISIELQSYRKSIRYARQHQPSKIYIVRLQELGILNMMPEGFGNSDAQHIIKCAEDNGKMVGGFNAYGEGDTVQTSAHPLYVAIHEQENKVIEALRLDDGSDLEVVPELSEDMPFDDNGGNPDGNAWLLTDYTPEQREILVKNGAEVVNIQVVSYERNEDGDMVLVIDGERILADDFPGEWMGMSASDEAYIVIDAVLNAVITASEACEVYGLAEATVRQAINRRTIVARKSGGTWLIKRADAERRWGKHIKKGKTQ